MPKLVANGTPGLVTSLGVLVSLATAFYGMSSLQGQQSESARHQESAEQRLEQRTTESNRRQLDSITDLRKELKDDLRHEVQVACSCSRGPRP